MRSFECPLRADSGLMRCISYRSVVGVCEQRGRDCEPDGSGGLQVDGKFELRRPLWPSLLGLSRVVQPDTILRWHRAGFLASAVVHDGHERSEFGSMQASRR
ncbi:MAG: hypothetical protein WBW13_13535, partial [Pseudolabrys sp.]